MKAKTKVSLTGIAIIAIVFIPCYFSKDYSEFIKSVASTIGFISFGSFLGKGLSSFYEDSSIERPTS